MDDRSASRRSKRDALTPSHCEIPDCEYVTFFQRHRITPGRDGGKYKLGNVIALCPNHHAEADAELLDPEILREIVRIRIENGTEATSNEASLDGSSEDPTVGCRPSEESREGDGRCSPDAGDADEAGLASE